MLLLPKGGIYMSTLGKRIKRRRLELGLTQEELAKRMEYKSKSTINKLEMDKSDLTQSKIIKMAEALETSIDYIMGWDEDEEHAVPDFDPDVLELIEIYAKLTDEQKKSIMSVLRAMVSNAI